VTKRLTTLLCLCLLLAAPIASADPADLTTAFSLLGERSFTKKAEAIPLIANSGHPRARQLLSALLEGQLKQRKTDGRLVWVEQQGDTEVLLDPLTGAPLAEAEGGQFTRLTINNQMRVQLRNAIADMSLADADPAVRLAAVREMTGELDDERAAALERQLADESSSAVKAAIETALALRQLQSADDATRLAAIQQLGSSLEPQAQLRLTTLVESEESSPAVKRAAQESLRGIEQRKQLAALAETLFFGLSLGSVLVLAAIGLAITFGVMGVINMAHGELMMLGAYTTYVVQQLLPNQIGLSLALSIPAAFVVAGLVGVAIERGVIRFLYGRPLETLLATFGISLVLQQLVRTIFSPLNRTVATPEFMSGTLEINAALSLTLNRLYIFAFCLLVFAALVLVLKRTRLGLQVRAVSQNRAMARAMGVRSEWVDALTFGLGSGIAGVAGVALSQLTNVGPNLGQAYIIDSFMVVVFGGVGNLWGTLIAGLSLGVANKVLEPWAGAVLAKILVLVFIILFIQKRPRGLFPQKGRAVEA